MTHIIAYEGHVAVALGLMQEEYVPLYTPWINRRTDIEGTLLRPPYSIEQGNEWVRGLVKTIGKTEVFAVLLREDSNGQQSYRYIGHTGLHDIRWPEGTGSTGSVIGAEDARGKRYGTEAKLLLLYHAFYICGLRKVSSGVKAFNAQSLGHLLKCGYRIIGRQKAHIFHNGLFVDDILLEVFREEWEPIWYRYQETKTLPTLTSAQRSLVHSETTS